MPILSLDEASIAGMFESYHIGELWVETDEGGSVIREIGFSSNRTPVHFFPGKGPQGRYGIIETKLVNSGPYDSVSRSAFDRVWEKGSSALK